MTQRTYTVYLSGGNSFTLKASRFEQTEEGIVFYGADDQPLEDTYIDASAVIAVIPPSSVSKQGQFPTVK